MTSDILLAIAEIFGIFAVGWFARWRGYLREQDLQRWSRLVIDLLFPLLIFSNIVRHFEADRLGELWPLPVIGLGMIIVGALAGVVLRRWLRDGSPDVARTFHHFCAINNYGFLPIIIVGRLWGAEGLARLFFFNLGSTIGYWTVGVSLLGEFRWGGSLRRIITPSLVALFVALVLSVLGWNVYVPEVAVAVSHSAGLAVVPSMLILVGASLYPLPSLTGKRDLAYLTVVRLIALPAAFIGLLCLLPVSPDVRNIGLIVALMPTSVVSVILTRRFGGDSDFAARAAVVTTLIAAATVPAWLILLQWLGGL